MSGSSELGRVSEHLQENPHLARPLVQAKVLGCFKTGGLPPKEVTGSQAGFPTVAEHSQVFGRFPRQRVLYPSRLWPELVIPVLPVVKPVPLKKDIPVL